MRLFQAALDTCLDSLFFASLSVHGLHFTVYEPSINRVHIGCLVEGRLRKVHCCGDSLLVEFDLQVRVLLGIQARDP